MDNVVETPHPPVTQIVTGHFHEAAGYAAWRPRGTPDWLLIYTVSGKGQFGHAAGQIITGLGELVLLRPGTLHDYGVEPTLRRWELLWAHFQPRPQWLEWLHWPQEAPGLMRLPAQEPRIARVMARRFADMHRLATSSLRRRETFAMNALEELLLWCDTINPRTEQARIDGRVRAAMEYLCTHLSQRVGLDELAQVSGLSVSRLAHLFRQQVGTTPQKFLECERMNRAKQLLELTSRKIEAVAHAVGFENPFYFTLRFKRHAGMSPRQYRQGIAGTTGKQN